MRYDLKRLSPGEAAQKGFLVSGFGRESSEDFVTWAEHFLVLLRGDELLAFVLAYSRDKILPEEWLNFRTKDQFMEPFILIKQICVRPDVLGRGLARALYEEVFSREPSWPCFAAIVLRPRNERSILFHERLGFRKVFEATPPDGLPRGVLRRPPEDPRQGVARPVTPIIGPR